MDAWPRRRSDVGFDRVMTDDKAAAVEKRIRDHTWTWTEFFSNPLVVVLMVVGLIVLIIWGVFRFVKPMLPSEDPIPILVFIFILLPYSVLMLMLPFVARPERGPDLGPVTSGARARPRRTSDYSSPSSPRVLVIVVRQQAR
ncbi:hypothetical protein ACP70R_048042 [Stipagrostis hirtigluma subsp. patula]